MSFKFGLAVIATFVGSAMFAMAMKHDASINADGSQKLNRDSARGSAGCVYLYPSGEALYDCLMLPYGKYR